MSLCEPQASSATRSHSPGAPTATNRREGSTALNAAAKAGAAAVPRGVAGDKVAAGPADHGRPKLPDQRQRVRARPIAVVRRHERDAADPEMARRLHRQLEAAVGRVNARSEGELKPV